MTDTPHITDAELDAIKAGLEGVTPGPWHVPLDRHLWVHTEDGWALGTDSDTTRQTMLHLARLDPATVARLIARLEAAEQDNQRLRWQLGRGANPDLGKETT